MSGPSMTIQVTVWLVITLRLISMKQAIYWDCLITMITKRVLDQKVDWVV